MAQIFPISQSFLRVYYTEIDRKNVCLGKSVLNFLQTL